MGGRPRLLSDRRGNRVKSQLVLMVALLAAAARAAEPADLFQEHCAVCHGPDRLGITGPALLPESLARLRKPEAIKTIAEGRAATQMLPFAEKLSRDQIKGVVDYIYTPVSPAPTFSEAQMRASRIVHHAGLPGQPAAAFAGADMMNLFIVVET
ncbi:MAG: cytochrome c, partial [Azonexus sp.]|nr:cytochrome c [Azonexus sp.]